MNGGDTTSLFARLLCDVMIPAELSEAIRLQGYEVLEARTLPMEIQQMSLRCCKALHAT